MQHRMFFNEQLRSGGSIAEGSTDLPVLEGHAIVANVRDGNPFFTEEIDKTAITKSLQDPNLEVASVWNHDMGQPLAKYPSKSRGQVGSLELVQDEKGLFTVTRPTNTGYARDLITNMEAGIVSQMSFCFYPIRELLDESRDIPHFIVMEYGHIDVSFVTLPFYREAEAWIKRCSDVLESRMQKLNKKLRGNQRDYYEHMKREIEVTRARSKIL